MTPKSQNNKSETVVNYPIIGAINAAEEQLLGMDRVWECSNNNQEKFLRTKYAIGSKEIASIPEIESIASLSADEINQFMEERGFTLRTEQAPPSIIMAASVLKIVVDWLEAGEVSNIRAKSNDNNYPAAKLDGKGVSFFQTNLSSDPLIVLKTKTTDEMILLPVDANNGFLEKGLEEIALELINERKKPIYDFSSITFPMIDLDQTIEHDWLSGLKTKDQNDNDAIVGKVSQQTKFAMDHIGAVVESAALLGFECAPFDNPFVIDRPFLAVLNRPGLTLPFFTGLLQEDDWKQPER